MEPTWVRWRMPDGVLAVWLPDGQRLHDVGGVQMWSPDDRWGRFSVVTGAAGGGVEELLAAEREHGRVSVERDEIRHWGGRAVRRVRYRVSREVPAEVVRGPGGLRHVGGHVQEHTADFVFVGHADGRLTRAGTVVDDGAPDALSRALAEVLERLEIGGERL